MGPRRSQKKIKVRWGRIALVIGAVLVVVALIIGGGVYSFLRGIHTDLSNLVAGRTGVPAPKPGEPINVLILGLDTPQDSTGFAAPQDLRYAKPGLPRRTDTMLLFSFNPQEHSLSMISIPRDSEVTIPGFEDQGIQKINAAHAFGDSQAAALASKQKLKDFPNSIGPELAMNVVSKLLDVPVQYYVRTDVAGFVKLVDILDGVEMDVPQDMDYDDPYQDLHIHLKKGPQFLNGEKAMELVRFRKYEDGDITRVKVQQAFFRAVMKKALTVGALFKIPSLTAEASRYIDTNLTPSQILSLGTQALRLNPDKVESGTLPVAAYDMIHSESFVRLDMNGVKVMVDELIRGIDRKANAKIKVQVLNGSGVSGGATSLAGKLRKLGFNVTNVGNADRSTYTNTQVIGLDGDDDSKVVGKAVSGLVSTARLFQRKEKEPQFDVTVVVGKDYK